jgi:hypothetical protein
MYSFRHISILLFTALSVSGITETAISADNNHVALPASDMNEQESSVFPEGWPDFVAVHRQGRSVIYLIKVPPAPNARNNNQETAVPGQYSEIDIRRAVTAYLFYSKDFEQSLSIRELIYPFHNFL